MFSLRPFSISPERASHLRSAAFSMLSPASRTNSSRKPNTIATPMNGCRMRVQAPPPKKFEKKNIDGWKSASPESAARKKVSAMNQWFIRSPSR